MGVRIFNGLKQGIRGTANAAQAGRKFGPFLVKGERKLPSEPLQRFAPEPELDHDLRELLHLTALVLAVARSRASEDAELLRFLRLGERAVADIGMLMTAHSHKRDDGNEEQQKE